MRCTSYACRKSFGPNFVWEDSAKYNTVNSDTMGRILFINNKCGFATDYLHYHSLLEFRAFVATRAVKDVYQEVFGLSHSDKSSQFRVNHATGVMYWIAVHELEALGKGKERDIIIGNEISEATLRAYEHHLQRTCFLHPRPSTVHEIVADGHAKVHVKCDNVLRHSGKPKADKRIKPYGHGWFMLVHPKNLRILWARAMEAPEGNDILETALRETLPKYPKADGVVVDRACSFLPCACRIKAFNQVKYWSVDLFHAHGHTKDCPCNPLYRRRLKSRFESVNTSACEQVFSWFRGYARVLNEATPSRHAFKVLYFCKLHNQAVDAKDTSYLNPYSRSAKKGKRPYQCGSKKTAMKKPAAKASHTGVAKKPAAKVSHTGVAKKPATKKAFLKR